MNDLSNIAKNKEHALVIAGGMWQVPLIKYLQGNNYYVTVVDPYDASPGVIIADKHIKEDVRNKKEILSLLTDNYCVVTTDQSDISVNTVAFLSQRLHLPGNKESVVKKYTNKYLSRQYASTIGIPIPHFSLAKQLSDIKQFTQRYCPAIIKPCDSQSSKGIHLITQDTPDSTLAYFLSDALSYSQTKESIIEEFIQGYEITVEGFCANGKHTVLAISKKRHFKIGIASSLTYPAPLPEELKQKIIRADNCYVEKSGLIFGITHAEYIVNEDTQTFALVEIACRGGGTLISSDIIPWVSGFDTYKSLLKCLKGEFLDVTTVIPKERNAELHFFDFGDGEITKISGIEEARNIKGVQRLDFDYHIGDIIHGCRDDRSRQGFCIVFAEKQEQIDSIIKKVEETIKIELK